MRVAVSGGELVGHRGGTGLPGLMLHGGAATFPGVESRALRQAVERFLAAEVSSAVPRG